MSQPSGAPTLIPIKAKRQNVSAFLRVPKHLSTDHPWNPSVGLWRYGSTIDSVCLPRSAGQFGVALDHTRRVQPRLSDSAGDRVATLGTSRRHHCHHPSPCVGWACSRGTGSDYARDWPGNTNLHLITAGLRDCPAWNHLGDRRFRIVQIVLHTSYFFVFRNSASNFHHRQSVAGVATYFIKIGLWLNQALSNTCLLRRKSNRSWHLQVTGCRSLQRLAIPVSSFQFKFPGRIPFQGICLATRCGAAFEYPHYDFDERNQNRHCCYNDRSLGPANGRWRAPFL